MREIKFRAWDTEKKEWYKPTHGAFAGELFELFVGFKGDLVAHTLHSTEHESLWPDRFKLMQFTGLRDKNGKEIYEGDIIQGAWYVGGMHGFYGEIEFIKGAFMVRNIDADEDAEEHEKYCTIPECEIFRTIGNIYENPELLKP